MRTRGVRARLTALIVTAGLGVSGCGIVGNPNASPGTPASARSSAPSPSPPAPSLPEVGQCHVEGFTQQAAAAASLIDCAEGHLAETVYVGRFVESTAAEAPVVETDTSPNVKVQDAAYRDCSGQAEKYLGHSWIHPLVRLRVTMPTSTAWQTGDRWYRCDLYEVNWTTGATIRRLGSLKSAWPKPMCLGDSQRSAPQVECAMKHPSEYAGGIILPAGAKLPVTDKDFEPYHEKCWKLIGTYIGVTAGKARQLTGTTLEWMRDPAGWWPIDRVLLCFTWTGAKASSYVTGSAQGRKGKGL